MGQKGRMLIKAVLDGAKSSRNLFCFHFVFLTSMVVYRWYFGFSLVYLWHQRMYIGVFRLKPQNLRPSYIFTKRQWKQRLKGGGSIWARALLLQSGSVCLSPAAAKSSATSRVWPSEKGNDECNHTNTSHTHEWSTLRTDYTFLVSSRIKHRTSCKYQDTYTM